MWKVEIRAAGPCRYDIGSHDPRDGPQLNHAIHDYTLAM